MAPPCPSITTGRRLTCLQPRSEHLDRYHSLRYWCSDCKQRFRIISHDVLDLLKESHKSRCPKEPDPKHEDIWARYFVTDIAQDSRWRNRKWRQVCIPRQDGETIPRYSWRRIYNCLFRGAVVVEDGVRIQTLEGHSDWVLSVAFSPDGQQIVSGSVDKTVKVWDRTSGACVRTLGGHGGWALSVAFSPDGQQIVSGSVDKTVKVWDRTSGACVRTLGGHGGWVRSVAFSPDGQQIVSGSDDRTVKVWDRTSGACVRTLEGYGL